MSRCALTTLLICCLLLPSGCQRQQIPNEDVSEKSFVATSEDEAQADKTQKSETLTAETTSKEPDQPEIDPEIEIDAVATSIRQAPVPVRSVRSLAFDDEATHLAVGTGSGEIEIWNLKDKKLLLLIKAHENWVFDVEFARDSTQLISAGGDNLTKIWKVGDDWSEIHRYEDHEDDVHGASMTSTNLLVTGSDDHSVIVRDMENQETTALEGHEAQVTTITLASHKLAFSASRDETIRAWNLESLESAGVLTRHTDDVLDIAVDRSGQFLASASLDGTVKVWSTETLSLLNSVNVTDDQAFTVNFDKDATHIISGSGDHAVQIHDWRTGDLIERINVESDPADIELGPNGAIVAVGTSMNGTLLYTIENQKLLHEHTLGGIITQDVQKEPESDLEKLSSD